MALLRPLCFRRPMFCSSRNGTDYSRNHAGHGFHQLPSFLPSSIPSFPPAWVLFLFWCPLILFVPGFPPSLPACSFLSSFPRFLSSCLLLPCPFLAVLSFLVRLIIFFVSIPPWSLFWTQHVGEHIGTESTLVGSQRALSPTTLTLWIGRRWASCYTILEPARLFAQDIYLSWFPTGPRSSSRRVEMQSKTRNEVTAWEWHQTCKFCHLTADTPMTSLDSEVTQLPVPYSSPVERPQGRWNEKHAKVNRRIPQSARMCSPCNL